MTAKRVLRAIRLSMARLPAIGHGRIPDVPVHNLRDLWQGNSVLGVHLTKGEFIYQDNIVPLQPGLWGGEKVNPLIASEIHSFAWLRDLRELGTDNARLCARALVSDWMSRSPTDHPTIAYRPDVLAMRLTSWLGQYDFFAASADDAFRKQFMQRVWTDGRYVTAMLPPEYKDYKVFALLKGVMAVGLCLPEQFIVTNKISKFLVLALAKQILEDGMHIERNPEIQVYVLRDLVEIRLMYQLIQQRPPNELIKALEKTSRVLRSLRHGDGKLGLFNGSNELNAGFIERILSHATQKRVAMVDMKQGGYIRCYTNRATLLIDTGKPPQIGASPRHAGALSFEFSAGKQRIFVNCGKGPFGVWSKLLGATAAHSVLGIENIDSIYFNKGRMTNPNFEVVATHETLDGAHLIKMGHNGWLSRWGAVYQRNLYLTSNGEDLRGEERVESPKALPLTIRFHLHPSIFIEEDIIEFGKGKNEKIYVLSSNNKLEGRQIWWFRFDGANAKVEKSVYFGDGSRVASNQIVLYTSPTIEKEFSPLPVQETVPDQENISASLPDEDQKGNNDYVAIFHHQNDDQTNMQTNDHIVPSEASSEPVVQQEITNSEPVVEQVIKWALYRQL